MLIIIFLSGRPPWYNSQGQLKEAYVIGKLFILSHGTIAFSLVMVFN